MLKKSQALNGYLDAHYSEYRLDSDVPRRGDDSTGDAGGMPAASLEFNHRAMSLKSIREERNDHFEIHRDRSLAQMRSGHDVYDQHKREKAADCDN